MNQTEQATIDLVINGRQAETSLGSMGRAVISLTRQIRAMTEADDPARYAELIARRNQLNDTYQEMNTRVMGARRSLQQMNEAVQEVDSSTSKFWNRVKSFALGDVIGAGVRSLLETVKGVWDGSEDAFKEAELTQTALANKMKQTGGAVGETKEQLVQLQTELMKLTGVDDDVIAKGEDTMLSFTNVRGVIFNQSIPAVVNWVAAMNNGKVSMEGIQSGAEILGKGLDDLTKIKKTAKAMDITLTEAEYNEIEARRKNNDVIGGQQLFIDALNKRYGSLAETLSTTEAGAAQRFQTRIGNIQESFGKWITQGKNLMAQVLSPFLDFVEKITSSKLSETMEQERLEMNMLVLQITDANTKQDERVTLIKKLKEQYPGYLQSLDAEKSSNLEIAKAGELVNDMYINRIILAKKDEEIENQNKVTADLRLKSLAAEQDMREALAKLKDKMPNLKIPDNGSTFDKLSAVLKQYQQMQENAHQTTGGIFDPTFAAGRALNEYRSYFLQAQEAAKGGNMLLVKRQELMKELGMTEKDEKFTGAGTGGATPTPAPIAGGPTGAETKAADAAAAAKKKGQDEALAMSKEFTEKIIQFNAAVLDDTLEKNDKEVQSTANKFDKMISESEASLTKYKLGKYANDDDIKKHEDQIEQLKLDKVTAVNAVKLKQERELQTKIEQLRDTAGTKLQSDYDKEIEATNQKFDAIANDASKDADVQYYIYMQRQAALSEVKTREEQRLQDELKKIRGEAATSDADKTAALLAEIDDRYAQELDALKKKYSAQLQATQEFKDLQDAILNKKSGEVKKALSDGPEAKADKERLKQTKLAAVEGAQTIANAVAQINQQRRQAETDAQIAALESQKDKELSNTSLTAAQRDVINEKYRAKEAAVKLKAWEADKDAAIKQAIIDGALGLVKLWVSPGFPAAIPMTIALGAATIAQIATISSQPAPAFGDGGSTAMAYSNNPAGFVTTPTLFKGRYVAGEKGAEWIAPNWMLQNPYTANVMGALEALRQQGPQAVNSTGAPTGGTPQQSSNTAAIEQHTATIVQGLNDLKTAIQNQEVSINYKTFTKEMDRIAKLKSGASA